MMQINQSISKSVLWGIFIALICISGMVRAQEEELTFGPDQTPSTKGIALPFDLATVIIKDGKYGFENSDSIFDLGIYDKIEDFTENTYLVRKENKYGFTNEKGSLIASPIYDTIITDYYRSSVFYVSKNNKSGAINDTGLVLLPLNYARVIYANSSSQVYLVADKAGELSLLAGAKYKKIKPVAGATFYNNAAVIKQNGKYGVIFSGEIVVPPIYDSIYTKHAANREISLGTKGFVKSSDWGPLSAFIVLKDNKKGIIKPNGAVVFEPEYDLIKYTKRQKYFLIKKGDKVGVYDLKNDYKIPVTYDYINVRIENFYTLSKDGKKGLIRKDGEVVFPCEYDKVRTSGYDKIMLTKEGKNGLYDQDGYEILPPKYDEIDKIRLNNELNNHYIVAENGLKGIVTSSKVIVPINFDHLYERNGFIVVHKDKSVGLFSVTGEEILPAKYDRVYHTVNKATNIMVCEKDGKLGIISRDGKSFLIGEIKALHYIRNSERLNSPSTPNKAELFLRVQGENGKWGVFDELNCALKVPIIYDAVVQKLDLFKSSYFIVEQGGKMGVINSKNEILVPFEYDELNFDFIRPPYTKTQLEVKIVAKKKKKYGIIDFSNKVLVPLEYEQLSKISFNDHYKAKTKAGYAIINSKNEIINPGPFDQVGDFNKGAALTFSDGNMRGMNESGQLISDAKPMTFHQGFRTFEALKQELIQALNSEDDALLLDFARKVSPGKHILYLFSKITHTYAYVEYLSPTTIIKRTNEVLLKYKGWWNSDFSDKNVLISIEDYTVFEGRVFTNQRTNEKAFGNKYLEWILRDAIRLDGFWVSTFFIKSSFK